MGAGELRTAFNEVAGPRFECLHATLGYEQSYGIQWQRLTFRGTGEGTEFEIKSDLLRPESDVVAAAQEVAGRLLAQTRGPSNALV